MSGPRLPVVLTASSLASSASASPQTLRIDKDPSVLVLRVAKGVNIELDIEGRLSP